MRIGKYRILFNPHKLLWFQTYKPTVARQWWWFLILEEVDVYKTSTKSVFKLGTEASCVGRKFRYLKFRE